MRFFALCSAAAALLLMSCAPGQGQRGDLEFSPERIKADIGFLADDLLEGRATGTRGHEIASRFVAARFAAPKAKR